MLSIAPAVGTTGQRDSNTTMGGRPKVAGAGGSRRPTIATAAATAAVPSEPNDSGTTAAVLVASVAVGIVVWGTGLVGTGTDYPLAASGAGGSSSDPWSGHEPIARPTRSQFDLDLDLMGSDGTATTPAATVAEGFERPWQLSGRADAASLFTVAGGGRPGCVRAPPPPP